MLELRRDAAYEAGQIGLLYVDMQTIWVDPGLDTSHPDWTADQCVGMAVRDASDRGYLVTDTDTAVARLEAVRAHAVA